jgi:hypothetical protein
MKRRSLILGAGALALSCSLVHAGSMLLLGVGSAGSAAAPAGCAQATTYLARTTGGNEGGNAAPITALICGLVTDGTWTSLDALYIPAQQNQADALLDLTGGGHDLSVVGGGTMPTFTTLRGFGPFGGVDGLQTIFNPPGTHFTQNNASFGAWLSGLTKSAAAPFGTGTGVGQSHLYPYFTDNSFYPRVVTDSTPGVASPGTSGLYVGDRPSSATVVPYYNGSALASQSSVSETISSAQFTLGDVGVETPYTIAEAHIAGSLGASNLQLYNRLRTYMTAVGVP